MQMCVVLYNKLQLLHSITVDQQIKLVYFVQIRDVGQFLATLNHWTRLEIVQTNRQSYIWNVKQGLKLISLSDRRNPFTILFGLDLCNLDRPIYLDYFRPHHLIPQFI